MRWSPEPLSTYARARVGGYTPTFYRGEVLLLVTCWRFGEAATDPPHRVERSPLRWKVFGSKVEDLLAGCPRGVRIKSDDKPGPTMFNQHPNRFIVQSFVYRKADGGIAWIGSDETME